MKRSSQELVGYFVGALLVWLLIPGALWALSRFLDGLLGLPRLPLGLLGLALAIALALLGGSFAAWSLVVQRSLGEGGPVQVANLDISPRTRKLVVSGPYRFTRNPMLFGAFLIYLAFAILLGSLSALLAVAAFLAFMLIVVVRSEERRLVRDFGKEYEDYRARTSGFFPWPAKARPKPG